MVTLFVPVTCGAYARQCPLAKCPCAGSRGRPAAQPGLVHYGHGALCACCRASVYQVHRWPAAPPTTPRVPQAYHAASGKSAQHGALSSRPVWSPQGACSDSEARSQVRALAPLSISRRYLIYAGMRMPLRVRACCPSMIFCRTGPIRYGVLKTEAAYQCNVAHC